MVGIVDSTGNVVVEYSYDAWGKPISTTASSTLTTELAELNPFRYRGYVWDKYTQNYYLNKRLYWVLTSRFLQCDNKLGQNRELSQSNYAYCLNNPINRMDKSGGESTSADKSKQLFIALSVVCNTLTYLSHHDKPCSDIGAAAKYREMKGSTSTNDPHITNCYAYSMGIEGWINPGSTTEYNVDFSSVYSIGVGVILDSINYGYTIRVLSSYDSQLYNNEYRIALRSGLEPDVYSGSYDYHFMVQTDEGTWAEKHGPGGNSILHSNGENPENIPWTLYGRPYYNSEILYFAIGLHE